MSSSDIPSLKGSLAGSAPMLTNGSTAIEGAASPDEFAMRGRERSAYPAASRDAPTATSPSERAARLVTEGGATARPNASLNAAGLRHRSAGAFARDRKSVV